MSISLRSSLTPQCLVDVAVAKSPSHDHPIQAH